MIYEIKTEVVYKDFSKDEEMFDFSNYSTKSKYDDSDKLIVGKMKVETGVTIKEFVGLKQKMDSFLLDAKLSIKSKGCE